MNTLIIYDSVFGNTEKIARVMGDALSETGPVEVLHVSKVNSDSLIGRDVLLVGSPTRAFQPTKGIKQFFKHIPGGGLKGMKVGAFDTRASLVDINSRFLDFMVKLFGYAAEPIDTLLVKKGGERLLQPAGFFVKDSEGPLKEGEAERAAEWVNQGK
jgi:flavodoxin